jgi:glycosyltransferase involved in cell wall biosynthesis
MTINKSSKGEVQMDTRVNSQLEWQQIEPPLEYVSRPDLPAGIPTDDPQAALHFCQQLSRLVASPQFEQYHSSNLVKPAHPDVYHQPEISVVLPVYEEEANLQILYSRLTKVLLETEPDYEIIFIDDGSHDGSLKLMHEIAQNDSHVLVVELARNFGHQVAISAGIDHARGRGVIIMDADLQDPPEVLPQFIEKWREGHDVVYAVRTNRKEGWLKRTAYNLFYRVLQRIANIEIPLDAGDFSIMDRKVVDILVSMPERNRFVRGIRSWVGLDQVGVPYTRDARYAGKPKFTFSRLVYLALDGLISFSFIPLRMITLLGFGVSFLSILLAIGYTIQKLTWGLSPPGFATTVVAIFFLAGIQLITIGVIGEYVGRIFEEVKRRPLYVIRRVSGLGRP